MFRRLGTERFGKVACTATGPGPLIRRTALAFRLAIAAVGSGLRIFHKMDVKTQIEPTAKFLVKYTAATLGRALP